MNDSINSYNELEAAGYNMAWNHFCAHAQQRVYFFNFFIILLGAMMTMQVNSIIKDTGVKWLGFSLGVIQVILCFVFWKVDVRNKFLTKHSENVIMKYEKLFNIKELRLMTIQENDTEKLRKNQKRTNLFTKQYSFSGLINFIYILFSIVSIIISILALIL